MQNITKSYHFSIKFNEKLSRNNIVKTPILNTQYLRSLCGCQSDRIINDNVEVIHKMARQPGTFVIFRNFLSSDYRNFNEKSTILKG